MYSQCSRCHLFFLSYTAIENVTFIPPAAFQISVSARQTKQGVWWFILSLLRSPLSDISQKQVQPEMYKLNNEQNSYLLFLNMDWSLQNNDLKK